MRRAALLVVATAVVAGGCSSEPPLRLGGYGNILDPVGTRTPYFGINVCSEGGPATVRIAGVVADEVSGTRAPVEFAIAWPDGPPYEAAISSHDPLPDAYVPAEGAEGTVGECGDPEANATLAVLFPPTGRRPVTVRDVRVSYTIDGREHTSVAPVDLTQCPRGTRADGGADGPPCTRRSTAQSD